MVTVRTWGDEARAQLVHPDSTADTDSTADLTGLIQTYITPYSAFSQRRTHR